MSTRVLNPVAYHDFHKVRSPPTCRNLSYAKLDRIKRDLFGAPDPVEIKRLYESEIKKKQEVASKKWDFDFLNGEPLNDKPIEQQKYIWERVTYTDFMPAMYTLTRAAHVRELPQQEPTSEEDSLLDERADRENANSSLESILSEEDDVFKVPSLRSSLRIKSKLLSSSPTTIAKNSPVQSHQPTISCSASLGKRQPKITEYMKERKRLISATPKKHSPPSKRMRTTSPLRSPSSTFVPQSSTSTRLLFRNQ